MPVTRLMRVAREKGPIEIGRRILWHALTRSGSGLLRFGERIAPDYSHSLSKEDRRLLLKNRALKDIHSGKRCFVIGNGPSLREQDIRPLAREITFAANSFFEHEHVDIVRPTYY